MKTLASLLSILLLFSCTSPQDEPSDIPAQEADSSSMPKAVTPAEFPERVETKWVKLELTEDEQQLSEGNKTFALNLFKQTYKTKTESNFVVSPLSLSYALAMTANGATGNTLSEIKSVLGFENYPLADVNAFYKKLTNYMLTADGQTILATANSVWANQHIPLLPDFINVNKDNYAAEVQNVNFGNPNTVQEINQWVSDQTYRCIPALLNETNPNDIVYLINALYFDGLWQSAMGEYPELIFTNADGSKSTVPAVTGGSIWAKREYYAADNAEIGSLHYGNGAYSMVFVLPKTEQTVQQTVESLTLTQWNEWMEGLKSGYIIFAMPTFRLNSSYDLVDDLKTMGIRSAFSSPNKEFMNMVNLEDIYISKIVQKTYIDVNKKGTTASAASLVKKMNGMTILPEPTQFYIDHPFLFAIKENSTNTILFMGSVEKL
ncbi:MAG: serpin family protein [Mediterranea sp.]|jgi:serpin B|nr:serpin family protein [Mediterranea sp.]